MRLFVAADIHGSEVCFRKFVNAARFYGANVLVLGGDLTGKALVPLVHEGGGRYRLTFMGRMRVVESEDLQEIEHLIRFNGYYPYRCEPEEADLLVGSGDAVREAFAVTMREQLGEWVRLADERLADSGIACLVMPGNDDEAFVPEILSTSESLQNHDGRTIEVNGHRIAGYGWSNPTPWKTPREKPEEQIQRDLRRLLESSGDPETLIFNPHVPPYDTGLDLAPQLRPDFTMVTRAGQPVHVPVGSHAVRQVVEEFQPFLVLSGHIHESRGRARLGRSICVNPGSEYNAGRLLGALIELGEKEVRNVQFVAG